MSVLATDRYCVTRHDKKFEKGILCHLIFSIIFLLFFTGRPGGLNSSTFRMGVLCCQAIFSDPQIISCPFSATQISD